MKYILFPTKDAADAFIADMQTRGAVQPEVGSTTLNRRTLGTDLNTSGTAVIDDVRTGPTSSGGVVDSGGVGDGGTAEDAGAGAVKGTVVGAVTGVAAALIGGAATIATGGLALPVILGMAALGSGVGAAVGGIGGAAGVDETGATGTGTTGTGMTATGYATTSDVDDDYYNRIDSGVSAGGRAVAVEDTVPQDVLDEAVRTHGGKLV